MGWHVPRGRWTLAMSMWWIRFPPTPPNFEQIIMHIEKQVVEAKPRKLKASYTLELTEDCGYYSHVSSRNFLKKELKSYGLKVRWFGLESKKSMVKRLDNALGKRFSDSITKDIDEMLLEQLIKEVNK